MSSVFAALLVVARLNQVSTLQDVDASVRAIAPFVESDVFAVVQIKVARPDVAGLSERPEVHRLVSWRMQRRCSIAGPKASRAPGPTIYTSSSA